MAAALILTRTSPATGESKRSRSSDRGAPNSRQIAARIQCGGWVKGAVFPRKATFYPKRSPAGGILEGWRRVLRIFSMVCSAVSVAVWRMMWSPVWR